MGREHKKKSPIEYGQALENRVCPYCARRLAPGTGTKEHLLPRGLTGGRPYDFLACQKCNNEKSKYDDTLVSIARMGNWSPHLKAGFDKMIRSDEGQKSLRAFLKHFNFPDRRERPDGNWTVYADDAPTNAFLEWLKWVVRGAYFLETNSCLKPKEKLQVGGYFIHQVLLTLYADARTQAKRERVQVQAAMDKVLHHPHLQTFGEESVYFLGDSTKTGMCILLGKEYLLSAVVVPYTKHAFRSSINERIAYLNFLPPDIQGKRVVDVKKGTLIFG